MNEDKSYIVTYRRRDNEKVVRREHFSARSVSDAALMAESSTDSLWEVQVVELLR